MTLEQNVRETNSVLVAIKDKIVECGVDVAEGTHAREYAPKIEQVYEEGKKSQYDEFWDGYLSKAKQTGVGHFLFAGSGWNEHTKFPYKIDFITDGYGMFNYCGNIPKTELKKIDFSKINLNFPTFSYSSVIKEIPELDTRGCDSLGTLFAYCTSLKSIDKIILRDDGSQTFSGLFGACRSLTEVRFEGIIGQNGFDLQWSTQLSKASITSIINCLSTTTNGLSITLSKTAVETAFDSTESAEWTSLINTRSNWTINLI